MNSFVCVQWSSVHLEFKKNKIIEIEMCFLQ